MSGCETEVLSSLKRCGRPGAPMLLGCVHEHIAEGVVCTACSQQTQNGRVVCAKCLDATDPHRCVLSLLSERVAR